MSLNSPQRIRRLARQASTVMLILAVCSMVLPAAVQAQDVAPVAPVDTPAVAPAPDGAENATEIAPANPGDTPLPPDWPAEGSTGLPTGGSLFAPAAAEGDVAVDTPIDPVEPTASDSAEIAAANPGDTPLPPDWPAEGQTGLPTGGSLFAPATAELEPAADLPVETAAPDAANAATWYVDGNGGTDGTCNTPGAPCRTIQAAIDRAASGDTILVTGSAGGTVYTFAGANGCTNETGAPSVVCVFRKQLTIRGGHPSGNFGSYAPATNISVIDGQGKNRGIFVLSYNAPGATSLDISGFTVRNGLGMGIGKRPGEDSYYGFGGGMFVEFAGNIVLRDMVFSGNKAVGNDRGSGRGGSGSGGGVSFRSTRQATLTNVQFLNNQALGGAGSTRGGSGLGGALYAWGSTLTGSSLVFDGNIARGGNSSGNGDDGGRAEGMGGACSFQENAKATLTNIKATNNQAIGGNAAVNAGGGYGGAIEGEVATITIDGADIRGNLAQGGNAQSGWFASGGGVMSTDSTLTINRATIVNNTAQGGTGTSGANGAPNGGGLMTTWFKDGTTSRLTLTNSIVADNKAYKGGGSKVEVGGGGGLWIQATEAVLDHTTVANNRVTSGEGMFGQGFFILNTLNRRYAGVTIRRSIISGHNGPSGSAVEIVKGNTVSFEGGLFFNNTWDTSATNPIVGGNNNQGTINGVNSMAKADPQYRSAGAPKFDYRITAGSPARNKASGQTQAVDVDNEPRNDGQPDWGADEYSPPPIPPVVITAASFNRSSIALSWIVNDESGQVTRYRLTDRYTQGGQAETVNTIDLGKATSHTLGNLTPYVLHTITIEGLNANNQVVATPITVKMVPTDRRVSLPTIRR